MSDFNYVNERKDIHRLEIKIEYISRNNSENLWVIISLHIIQINKSHTKKFSMEIAKRKIILNSYN
jgi:hypothetical protein